MHQLLAQSVRLLLALLALWVVLVGPAYLVGGQPAVVGLTAAVLVCLAPGLVVLGLQGGMFTTLQPLSSLLMAMGLRLAFVLACVLVVREVAPDLPATVFLVWLVPAYVVALAVETRMALTQDCGRIKTHVGSRHLRVTGSSLNEHPAN